MRFLAIFGLLTLLTACSGDPRAYGITGPGVQSVPDATKTDDATTAMPGVPTPSSSYGPSNGPVTGGSRFWGYN